MLCSDHFVVSHNINSGVHTSRKPSCIHVDSTHFVSLDKAMLKPPNE